MKKILINNNPWQTRIAITKDEALQNIYFSAHATENLERIFFKGIITKVLPGIQTAFVEIGQDRAGFLHISEIDRELAIEKISKHIQMDDGERVERPSSRQPLDISKILREGDPILVQVSKEPVYEKGAKLTTCFTLPGRFAVLMPNIPRIGVSKKIEDREERNRLKDIVKNHLPDTMGAIIRTTSENRNATEIGKDLDFLIQTWNDIQKKFETAEPKEKLHEDLDLTLQVVRDNLDDDVEFVIADTKLDQNAIYKFVKNIAPEYSHKVKIYDGAMPLFEHFNIEKQIEAVLNKKVELKSGGSLIIESTEAMTVVDVNTGKFVGKSNMEETIFKTNLEAAEEVVRQLRLRNIGGLIVIDFIDMAISGNRQKLFKFFEKNLKEQDKFQSVVLKVSEFGLVQMTRKRSGKTLVQELTHDCPTCKGSGFIKSLQTECYWILRKVKEFLQAQKPQEITLTVNSDMFTYISNTEYNAILYLEKNFTCKIAIQDDKKLALSQYKIEKK
ncbi:MAG: Rne/Rng family ribonuclease [Candidatus Dependentiae bacterium]|nr:Rne/Rng family ribonuclease [Candidatus Dependentiae bacterium]